MRTKHTKGEWWIDTSTFSRPLFSTIFSGNVRIAEVKSYGKDKDFNDATFEEKEANAKLIAAAPDLLKALNMVIKNHYSRDFEESLFDEIELQQIELAIKKATE